MQVVVASSPGPGAEPHWSLEVAQRLCAALAANGARVRWLAALYPEQAAPSAGGGVEVEVHRQRRTWPLRKVGRRQVDIGLERSLSGWLRDRPGVPVVHVGLGGDGTPNVLWLADRMGSPTVACVRGAELVCARADRRDREGQACSVVDDPERCQWCCTAEGVTGWLRRPRVTAFQNRSDLFAAGLQVCSSVVVQDAADVPLVTSFGVPESRVAVAEDLVTGLLAAVG